MKMDQTWKIKQEISRRGLLRHLGNAAVALPFMRTLLETQAFGEVSRKRAVIFFYPNGIPRGRFHPDATGPNFVLKAATSNLEKVRSDIIILNNLNYNISGTHEDGLQYCLTGTGGRRKTVSIDTVLGERMKANVSLPVLRLGSGAGTHEQPEMRWCSYFAEGKASQIENNPTRAFQNIFGTGGNTTTPVKGVSLSAKKSILDASVNDIKRLQASIGSVEKQKLDLHIAAVREIERRLAGAPDTGMSSQCTKTLKNTKTFPLSGNQHTDYNNIPDVIDLNNQIAIQAMACGVTNVVFIQNSSAGSYTRTNNQGVPSNSGLDGHEDAHTNPARHAVNINYYMGQFANLIAGMKEIKEGDQTLLYNFSLMALTEFADGVMHDMKGVGVILAGQGGGYYKTGYCIDVRGASHNKVLVTMLQSLGYTDNTFGDPNLGSGVLDALKA